MGRRLTLTHDQLYDTRYATVKRRASNYNKSLENLHQHIENLKDEEKQREIEEFELETIKGPYYGCAYRAMSWIWRHTFGQFSDDWLFLAALGIFVAIISYITDKGVMMCGKAKMWLYNDLAYHDLAKYFGWISLPVCLILFDVGFTSLVAPQATGSGIPHIKTMLRGVILKEFLAFKVLIAKWVGITSTLGSGMPLGKEGPLIHISSIILVKMTKAVASLRGVYVNKSKTIEMLGAAWAVGVACTFNSPIGGVLFSVEITTAYYAVRNYWRGFFAAVWAATTYRLLSVWIDEVDTITVVFKTSFFVDFPYAPQELFAFAITGVLCGFGGSLYIWCKQCYNGWLKNNDFIKKINKLSRFIYPGFVALLVSTITFPLGVGQFIASDITPREQVINLFANYSWTSPNLTLEQHEMLKHWTTRHSGIYTNLVCFFFYNFIFSIISSTMPIPNGSFIPNFRCGAAAGRIIGELMVLWFPLGVRYKGKINKIIPAAYATVGAAAFSGAVTQTMSVCVILFEMTSQITHVIPVLIAVLLANGIARLLVPSLYDLVIQAKKLPFLPDLLPRSSAMYNVMVSDFMVKDIKYIFLGMTYLELQEVLMENKKIKNFPLVDHPQNMILLGSIPRHSLLKLLEYQIGREKRFDILPEDIRRLFMGETENEPSTSGTTSSELRKERRRQRILEKYELRGRRPSVTKSGQKVTVPVVRVCDLDPEQQKEWARLQMTTEADFTKCHVDPAPFQLVEKTSLLKVHSLFSLMAINIAYVTSIGKLVGVVGFKELRKAIEDANSGALPARKNTHSELQALLPRS